MSIYPSNSVEKSEFGTNHTDKRKNEEDNLNKSATITEFDIGGNNKINNLEVSKETLARYQKRYS